MVSLKKAIQIIINTNLVVKRDEKLLIVYDSKKANLASEFERVSKEMVDNVKKIKMKMLKVNGQEPDKKVANAMKKCNVCVILSEKSISHTKARRNATSKGVRLASMPGITESILKRSIDIDYTRLDDDLRKLKKLMNKTKEIRIKTSYGTDLSFSIKGRKAHGLKGGIFNKKGYWGNLPEGEAFVAPVEGSANGVFVVDGSIAGFGRTKHPVIFFVEKGKVVKIKNGPKPPKIEAVLNKIGDKARNIAEFGIGLNRKAKITGIVLEDEKKYKTCHIALGNNIGFGGKVDVQFHVDCVMTNPDIYFDGVKRIKKGKIPKLF